MPTLPSEQEQLTHSGTPVQRRRLLLFLSITLLSSVAASIYVAATLLSNKMEERPIAAQPAAPVSSLTELRSQPYVVFLQSDGDAYRRVSLTSLQPGAKVVSTDLVCQRVYYVKNRGLCLGEGANLYGSNLAIFDDNFAVVHRLSINGIPTRARISSDGRYGSVTVFVAGHSYADVGFSTRTAILDMVSGQFVINNLEDLRVMRDGRRFTGVDFNFWGVTFAEDSDHFYATLGSGGQTYLIEGSVSSREAKVLKQNVECPSLSPDGTRLVFKKRFTHGLLQEIDWRLYVLDLATMTERPLAETRNVDDQAEWMDDSHVAYFLRDEGPPATIRPDLWTTAVDSNDGPKRLWTQALSPAVVLQPDR